MNRILNKSLSLVLVLTMLFTMGASAYASESAVDVKTLSNAIETLTDEEIYINGIYYTKNEFIQLLDEAVEIESDSSDGISTYSVALVAGTWWIPGVGEVVITIAGVVIVAGVVYKAGSWVYEAVSNWFAAREFKKSADKAVDNCNSNKQNHIMNSKHNWNKFNKDPKWSTVAPILKKVLADGDETWEKSNQYIRTLVYQGETVVVRFIKDAEGLVNYISTAWTE